METRAFIERNGGIAHRHDLLQHMINLGIMGAERSPMASYAAYLSGMREFESLGEGRWRIASGAEFTPPKPRRIVRAHIPGSLSSQVVEFSDRYLREKGARAESPEIVAAMRAAGMDINVDAVSSSLSHSGAFDNVRGQGYGLAEWSASKANGSLREAESPSAEKPGGDAPGSFNFSAG
jgi:hypothetical protein